MSEQGLGKFKQLWGNCSSISVTVMRGQASQQNRKAEISLSDNYYNPSM